MTTASSLFATPRAKLLGAVVGVLVVVQMAALVMLCEGQVDRARERQVALDQQRMAINDCLHYARGSSIGDCMQLAAVPAGKASPIPRGMDAVAAVAPQQMVSTAMPVNVSYR